MEDHRVVIIGAGPAGVATAVSLRDRGVASVLVDRAGLVAASWRARYDRLKLNTGKQFSHLPGRPYPVETPTFPTRDDVADYFNEHARADGIELRLNTLVERIDPGLDGWRVLTTSGCIEAEHVVVATGFDHTPHVPDWPGRTRSQEMCCIRRHTEHHSLRRQGQSSSRQGLGSLDGARHDRTLARPYLVACWRPSGAV